MNQIEKGISNLNQVVEHFAKTYPKKDMFLLDSSGSFSECLAMSIIVKHLKLLMPSSILLWGMQNKYFEMWENYTKTVPSIIFPLPDDAGLDVRKAWLAHAKTLELADVQFPGLGMTRPNIGAIKNFILNAGISKMLVPTIPIFPHTNEDLKWHDSLLSENGCLGKPYIAIEYVNDERIALISKKIVNNVVWIGEKDSNNLKIDARGCNMLQAKMIIQRAKVFIASTDDYKNLSICDGLRTKTLDVLSDSPLAILGQANTLCQA